MARHFLNASDVRKIQEVRDAYLGQRRIFPAPQRRRRPTPYGKRGAKLKALTNFAVVTVTATANGGSIGKCILLDEDLQPSVIIDPGDPEYSSPAVSDAEIEFKCAHETLDCLVNRRVVVSSGEPIVEGSVFTERKVWGLLTDQVVYQSKSPVVSVDCDEEDGLVYDTETDDYGMEPDAYTDPIFPTPPA